MFGFLYQSDMEMVWEKRLNIAFNIRWFIQYWKQYLVRL